MAMGARGLNSRRSTFALRPSATASVGFGIPVAGAMKLARQCVAMNGAWNQQTELAPTRLADAWADHVLAAYQQRGVWRILKLAKSEPPTFPAPTFVMVDVADVAHGAQADARSTNSQGPAAIAGGVTWGARAQAGQRREEKR